MRTVALACVLVIGFGCGKRVAPNEAVSRAQCIGVRDHVVELIVQHYVTHGPETYDGLDRADASVMVGIPPGVTRETFGPFLASDAGKPWLANARARLVAGTGFTDTVEKCVQRGKPTHIACWLGATTMETFQRCPTP